VTAQASQSITRSSASNLALAFVLLPAERRRAMEVLYAFCRQVDDVADEETVSVDERQQRLAEWRQDVRLACAGEPAHLLVNQELAPVIARYRLPFEHFDELLRGVEMDLATHRYATFEELETYCYRVASVVGLLSIEVFGYRNPGCRDYAVALGKALQLTNILRDVRNDAERGRIYLPQEALARHGVSADEVLQGAYSERFRRLAQEVAQRAGAHYREARRKLPPEDRRSMVPAELMGSVYWRLLKTLDAGEFRVFGPRIARVSKPMKVYLILRTWLRVVLGRAKPNYGIG